MRVEIKLSGENWINYMSEKEEKKKAMSHFLSLCVHINIFLKKKENISNKKRLARRKV